MKLSKLIANLETQLAYLKQQQDMELGGCNVTGSAMGVDDISYEIEDLNFLFEIYQGKMDVMINLDSEETED